MSFAFLKQAAAAAGHIVSEGEELLASDMQAVRDYCHFNGVHIGEEFHKFAAYVDEHFDGVAPGLVGVPAAQAEAAAQATTEAPAQVGGE